MRILEFRTPKLLATQLGLILACTVCFLCSAEPAIGAQRIFLFDFENGQDLDDVFGTSERQYWDTFRAHVAITTNMPHSGVNCVRANLGTTSSDSVTGLPGYYAPTIQIGGPNNYGASNDINGAHSDRLYISFWWRWDPGVQNAGVKIIYNQGIYCGAVLEDWTCQPPPNGTSWNSYGYYPYAWNGGYRSDPSSFHDGNWHRVEEYFKYNSPGQEDGLFWARVDGIELYRRTSFANPGARLRLFAFGYEHPWTEGTCTQHESEGFQIDDIEIWNGLPPWWDNDQDGLMDTDDTDDDNDGVPDTADAFPTNAAIQTTERLVGSDNNPQDGKLSADELSVLINRWQAGSPSDNVQYEEVRLAVEWHITGTMPPNWGARNPVYEQDIANNLKQLSMSQ